MISSRMYTKYRKRRRRRRTRTSKTRQAIIALLKRWERENIDTVLIQKLKCGDLASILAAYLVDYDEECAASFGRFRCAVVKKFRRSYVTGFTIIAGEEEEKLAIWRLVDEVVNKVVVPEARVVLKNRLRRWMNTLGQND